MGQQTSLQSAQLNQAHASLQQAISWYSSFRRHGNSPPSDRLQATVKTDLQSLQNALARLDRKAIRISTFGLVSCGKSSLINALLGEEVVATGAVHGVTQSLTILRWNPSVESGLDVELIDTPGLDEVTGESRAVMARSIAQKSDLILFVVAGDITRTEYQALCELRDTQKPLILVFNKSDLYPDQDRQKIYRQLQKFNVAHSGSSLEDIIAPHEIVTVAAKPQPIQVRIESADGTVENSWEYPEPEIESLKNALVQILQQEGKSLLALNALVQARDAQVNIARKTIELRQSEAQEIIAKYARYKAIAVAVNPIIFADLLGGLIADLALIRSLSKLYGLPITTFEAGNLLRRILASTGGLLLGEVGSSFFLSVGKSGAILSSGFDSTGAITAYLGTASVQGAIAGYGTFVIGRVAQVYLEQGCTWGEMGASTLIKQILSQVEPKTIIYRLKQELMQL
ncbi:GTPase [Pleurocapsa sp. CCALA 161]|uniref:GTP-binding protein n=1 Tax=Pleurocapsa sp. CCALA 161 TaxID=2107688 RepID=UPI000D0774F3|nr:GTP-binding protein [Pleurocapsa sp. CCALA 161]PSB12657.1 GTPase [Pleurocapsa sp. CCALA 161]